MNIQNITSEVLAQLSSLQLISAQPDAIEPHSIPYPLTNLLDNLHKLIQDGNGETIIHIDSAFCLKSRESFQQLFDKIAQKALLLDSACSCISETEPDNQHTFYTAYLLIRKKYELQQDFIEVRVAVVGNVDAGKSTMLGVLTKGILDDGRGKARVQLFKHKHEIETGRTSSIGQEIMCFDSSGGVIKCTEGNSVFHSLGWEELGMRASKVVNFIDLAGHERYLKTTMFGLTGFAPDFAMLMVGANMGLVGMTKEHLSLVFALNVPVFIVITKIDMCPGEVLEENVRQLNKLLRSNSCKRVPVIVKEVGDIMGMMKSIVSERICPIFRVSNVTGEGLQLLKAFLNLVPCHSKFSLEQPTEFEISEHFSVPGAGTVVAGTLIKGSVKIGQLVYLGPLSNGEFISTTVKGIQRKRISVNTLNAGQYGSIALKKVKRSFLRKGMVLLGKEHESLSSTDYLQCQSKACYEFEAEVLILYHSTTMIKNYQSMLHCGVVRQTVSIVDIEKRECLRTGDRAIVRFRFIKFPEFLRKGSRILFREGRTKGVGKILRIFE